MSDDNARKEAAEKLSEATGVDKKTLLIAEFSAAEMTETLDKYNEAKLSKKFNMMASLGVLLLDVVIIASEMYASVTEASHDTSMMVALLLPVSLFPFLHFMNKSTEASDISSSLRRQSKDKALANLEQQPD